MRFPRLVEAKCEGQNMSIITGVADSRVTSRILDTARRSLFMSALGAAMLLARALPVEAATLPQHPCTPELEKLMADWNAAGFVMPFKPNQAIVHGRSGRVSSGPEVTYMISQIRQAVRDCQRGDVKSAREHIALVTERLHPRS
jgi:hypothetical protein